MNAAFVILASALLGNHPAAASCNSPACAPAPVVAAPTCDTCSGPSFGHGFREKLSGLFPCHSCKAAAPCAAPCAAPAPAPAPCAAPAPACDSCGSSHGHGGNILGKLRGMFASKHSCHGCGAAAPVAACDSCGSSSAPAAVEAVPAPLPATGTPPATAPAAPKKMPDAPKGDAPKAAPPAIPKGDKAVRYEQTPEAPLSIPTTASPVLNNNRPAVIVAPATLRNPF
ncbi:MAG: hypothetical protein WCL32_13295 [Planctomycetota bacterium]